MLCQNGTYCNAELVKITIPATIADPVAYTLRCGIRQWCIPCRPVDELLDNALSVFDETPVIQTEDLNRGSRIGSITDCLNLTIKPETKDSFARRLKRRYEFGTIVIPPIILKPCAIARLSFHIVSWETREQIGVFQIRSMQVLPTATLWLDMLHMRCFIVDLTHRIGTQPALVCNHSRQY